MKLVKQHEYTSPEGFPILLKIYHVDNGLILEQTTNYDFDVPKVETVFLPKEIFE